MTNTNPFHQAKHIRAAMSDPPPTGKFRPRKKTSPRRSGRGITPGATAASSSSAPAAGAAGASSAPSDNVAGGRCGRGRGGRSGSPTGRRGRGRGGCGGRGGGGRDGGGGGGGRGRFVMPQGRAFFTGDQATDESATAASSAAAAAAAAARSSASAASACASADAAASAVGATASAARVVRPGASGQRSSRAMSPTGRGSRALDEGEETVLGEIEGGGVGGAGLADSSTGGKAGASLLGSSSAREQSSAAYGASAGRDMDDDGDYGGGKSSTGGSRPGRNKSSGQSDVYTYDSDSSDDETPGKKSKEMPWSPHAPAQLPLPPPRPFGGHCHILYDCQQNASASTSGAAAAAATSAATASSAVPDAVGSATAVSEEKKDDITNNNNGTAENEEETNAPVFLDLATANAEDRKIEAESWTLFKLPTRLPRIARGGGGGRVKSEAGGDGVVPMEVESSVGQGGDQQFQRYPGAPTPANRFDDSLRTVPSGLYGKIFIRKSGKAVLVVGQDTNEEVMLELNEGIPSSMLQQATNINPLEGTYTNMGEVHRSIVATPDIASAFPNH